MEISDTDMEDLLKHYQTAKHALEQIERISKARR